MKKRRVLALLMALSLAVSANGMTVFAAEAGDLAAPVVSLVEEGTEDGAEQADAEEDADDGQDIDFEDTDSNKETGGDSTEDQTGKEDDGANDDEDPDASGEKDYDEQSPDEEAVNDDPVSGSELPDKEEPAAEKTGALPGRIKHEVRMMTFTDDTGMQISYDANASREYIYEIENGVLLSVKTKEAGQDVSGNTIEVLKPVEFEGNVELTQPEEGEKYTSVAKTVFAGNQNITYVKLPDGVTTVAEEAFKGCTGLKGVYLPAAVTEIGASAFEACTAMTQISVPKAVTSIGDNAFKGDARLYMVYMKDVDYSCLEKIGAHAFDGCTALEAFCADTKFLLPTSLKEIGAYAFYKCKHIKTVNLETGILEKMGEYAFADCGLTDAVMSKTLPVIPKYAFYGCTALVSLRFESKPGNLVKIDEHAFEGCYFLTSLVLPGTIDKVADFAFAGCTNLYRVEVENTNLFIGKTQAFPVGETRSTLQFIGRLRSTTYEYCRGKSKVEFIEDTQSAVKKYYKYIVKDSNGVECPDGKVPGGQIWIGPTDKTKTRYEDNINTLKDDKGNVAGVQPDDTKKYRVYWQAEEHYSLVSGSLRANGEVLQAEKGAYYVTMPVGGIVITAAFFKEGSETVDGRDGDIVVEYSNGEPIDHGVEIKMGQTTRIFLIDKSGTPIDASKIKEITSDSDSVATVSKSGVVTAAGAGTATIRIGLLGGDGKEITLRSVIRVLEADADVIKLKPTAYDSAFALSGDPDAIQTLSIDKDILRGEALTITLKANAYTADKEGIAKEFTWTSSDTRVVKLRKEKTTGGDAANVLEVQKGCEGEATITVTAKNKKTSASPKDLKETVTQKFVVSVQSTTGRLASSLITVNPNLKAGGELEVLLAYGAGLDPSKTKLYEQSKDTLGETIYLESLKFTCELSGESAGKSYRYRVRPAEGTGVDTYKLFVGLNGVTPNADTLLPLTIKVAKSAPAPTVKFNTKKTKFNLFYKNGGVDKEGNPITVTTEITKLGTAKIAKCELEPLSVKEDDQKFIHNFEIVSQAMESGKYTVVIQKQNENLRYTNTKEKKPVVTGYLVLYYEGYEDSAAKKVKVTMPTCTTAPSYALKETKATYRKNGLQQEETFVLYDKKSKTKEQVKLVADVDQVTKEQQTLSIFGEPSIQEDGTVLVKFMPENGGKLKLALTNRNWDLDQNGKLRRLVFTYTVNVSSVDPTVKADKSTVSLNLNAPDEPVSFSLVPSQRGVQLEPKQIFAPATDQEGIGNLEVTYEDGRGLAKIQEGKTVKAGTYQFECFPQAADWPDMKKVTLNVKVVDNKPVVKLGKGSLQLNKVVQKNNADNGADNPALYRETAGIPFTITGKPEGYTIADVGTGDQATIITAQAGNIEKHFAFRIKPGDPDEKIDDMLEVSLRDNALSPGTYRFTMTQRYVRENRITISSKPITVTVKVYFNEEITLKVAAKGKINLVNRRGEANEKNGILYTPTLKNIRGEIVDVKIWEAGANGFEESIHFDAHLIKEGKNAGKIYVTPKVTLQSGTDGTGVRYEYAELDNNKGYPVRIWVKVDGYAGTLSSKNGVMSQTIQIKTAQVLPKVTTDKSLLNVYLATKEYDASFTVKPKENAVGEIEEIYFGEKDETAKDSFELIPEPQEDGSMKVVVHLKEAVRFANGSTNNIRMYVKYKGQGANTSETATAFTMKIKVN